MMRLRFWIYNKMQGGEINNGVTLCVLSLVFCLIFLRVQKGIIWLSMVVDKRKGKRMNSQLDFHEPTSCGQ